MAILLKSSDRIAHDLSEAGPSLSRELAVAVGGGGVTGGGEETEEAEAGARDGGHVGDRTGSVPAPSPSETHLSDVLSDNSFHPVLVLKKWVEIPPESEWRCFVRNGLLVGISQRDVTRVFPEIEARARVVRTALIRFHKHFVQPALARAGLERCVYDLYLDGRGRPFVLDVNTWGGATSPLLFEWKELEVAGEIAEEGSGGKGESDDPISE